MTSVQTPPSTPSQLLKEPPLTLGTINTNNARDSFHQDGERNLAPRSSTIITRGGSQRKILRTSANITTTPSIPQLPKTAASVNVNNPSVVTSPVPLLILQPLNDTFITKSIALHPGQIVKIGRQTNAKTLPNPTNGYFDSKVLSRSHAEVWSELSGKVFIKDVKSSNGTFVNAYRLSPEGVESEPYELHHEDVVEFGIDIVGDDSKTIVHHKVSARILIGSGTDASECIPHLTRSNTGDFMRRKSGINLDVILNRLHTELRKARDTGSELDQLTFAFGEIQENIRGQTENPSVLGDISSPAPIVPENPVPSMASYSSATTISSLQTRLSETQVSLTKHMERVAHLEKLLTDHEKVTSELESLKVELQDMRLENEKLTKGITESSKQILTNGDVHMIHDTGVNYEHGHRNEADIDYDNNMDDASSGITIMADTTELSTPVVSTIKSNGTLVLRNSAPVIPRRTSSSIIPLTDFKFENVTNDEEDSQTNTITTTMAQITQKEADELKERLANTQEKLDNAVKLCSQVEQAKEAAEERVRDLEARAERLEREMAQEVDKRVEERIAKLREELLMQVKTNDDNQTLNSKVGGLVEFSEDGKNVIENQASVRRPLTGLRRRTGTVTNRHEAMIQREEEEDDDEIICAHCGKHAMRNSNEIPNSLCSSSSSLPFSSLKSAASATVTNAPYITAASVLIAGLGVLALLNQAGIININLPRPSSFKS